MITFLAKLEGKINIYEKATNNNLKTVLKEILDEKLKLGNLS